MDGGSYPRREVRISLNRGTTQTGKRSNSRNGEYTDQAERSQQPCHQRNYISVSISMSLLGSSSGHDLRRILSSIHVYQRSNAREGSKDWGERT